MRASTAAASLVMLVFLAGCAAAPSSGAKTERVDVPMPAERSADIKLVMRSGDVKLAGAAAGLLEGTLVYGAADGKPTVTTASRESTAGKVVSVDVEQQTPAQGAAKREWDLRVNGGLPTNIEVSNASGDLDLDLKLADPKLLDVTSSSGRVALGLVGPHPNLSKVNVAGKSGDIVVTATGEYPALEGFVVDNASGNISVDFAGTWRKDFRAEVTGVSGNVTLVLPRDVNVRVTTVTKSGTVNTAGVPDFYIANSTPKDMQVLLRKADKPSPSELWVAVRVDSGDITLKLAEKK